VYLELCNVSDVAKLQNALDLITGWANEWQLSLSVNKCNILLIGKCQDNTPYYVELHATTIHIITLQGLKALSTPKLVLITMVCRVLLLPMCTFK